MTLPILPPELEAAADHVVALAENLALAAGLAVKHLYEGTAQELTPDSARKQRDELVAAIYGLAAGSQSRSGSLVVGATVISEPGSCVTVTRLELSDDARAGLRSSATHISTAAGAGQKDVDG